MPGGITARERIYSPGGGEGEPMIPYFDLLKHQGIDAVKSIPQELGAWDSDAKNTDPNHYSEDVDEDDVAGGGGESSTSNNHWEADSVGWASPGIGTLLSCIDGITGGHGNVEVGGRMMISPPRRHPTSQESRSGGRISDSIRSGSDLGQVVHSRRERAMVLIERQSETMQIHRK